MKTALQVISFVALGLTVLPSILVAAGDIPLETHYALTLLGTIAWFASAPFWMLKKKRQTEAP